MPIFEFISLEGNFMVLNLLLQVSLFSAVAIGVAMRFKHNAAIRYAILYPAMLSLCVLVVASIVMQSGNKNLLYIPLAQGVIHAEADLPIAAYPIAANAIEYIELSLSEIRSSGTADPDSSQPAWIAPGLIDSVQDLFFRLPLYLIAAVIWAGGFLCLILGLLRSLYKVESVSRHSKQLSTLDRSLLDKVLAKNLPKARGLHYRVSEQVDSPMLTGFVKPIVLLPMRFVESLNEGQLKNILLHELAHYERRDVLANFLQKVCLAVFWFNPLVHIMDRLISRAREVICDNYVLSQAEAVSYGETLLYVGTFSSNKANGFGNRTDDGIKSRAATMQLAVGIIGGEWKLEQRISELLSDHREKTMKLGTLTNQLLQLMLVLFSISLAACQVGAAEDVNPADEVRVVQVERTERVEQIEQSERIEQAERVDRIERVQRIVQVEQAEQLLLLAQAAQDQQLFEQQQLQQDAQRLEWQVRRIEHDLRLRAADLEQRAAEIKLTVGESINIEELRRTIASTMENLQINVAEIGALTREDGAILNEEEINEIVERALAEVQEQLESMDFAQLEQDLERTMENLQEDMQGFELDMATLLQDMEEMAAKFGSGTVLDRSAPPQAVPNVTPQPAPVR